MAVRENISGNAWVLGDNVNTDDLHPPSYFSMDSERMKEGIQAGIKNLHAASKEILNAEGLIIVAGKNFGCGSSRETSVRALIASGVQGVIAKSFARIFYRSMINLALTPFVCDTIQDSVQSGDLLNIFPLEQKIQVEDDGMFNVASMDDHFQKIIESGGLIGYLGKEMGAVL